MISTTFRFALAGAVAAAALVSSYEKAEAVPVIPSFGSYQMTDAFPTHGLWFGKELVDTNGNGLKNGAQTWAVESATLTYADGGAGPNTLNIDGVVQKDGFRLAFDFDLFEVPDVYDPACGKPGCQPTAANQDLRDGVRFFNFPDFMENIGTPPATISGLTSVGNDANKDLTGLEYALDIRPDGGFKPPQFGYCGNWVDCLLGYSNWFDYQIVSDVNTVATRDHGYGDLNLSAVPLPAAGWLLLAAVGGLFARGRFRA